jgi:hypothetical protein
MAAFGQNRSYRDRLGANARAKIARYDVAAAAAGTVEAVRAVMSRAGTTRFQDSAGSVADRVRNA